MDDDEGRSLKNSWMATTVMMLAALVQIVAARKKRLKVWFQGLMRQGWEVRSAVNFEQVSAGGRGGEET